MALTYTWRVASLKVTNSENIADAVCQVYWEKIGTDEEGVQGMFAGATPFTNFDPDNFTPFDQLTEQQVLGWVQALVVNDYEAHVNKEIQRDYEDHKNIVSSKAMPWGDGSDVPDDSDPVI